jgi:hypothetical protein
MLYIYYLLSHVLNFIIPLVLGVWEYIRDISAVTSTSLFTILIMPYPISTISIGLALWVQVVQAIILLLWSPIFISKYVLLYLIKKLLLKKLSKKLHSLLLKNYHLYY